MNTEQDRQQVLGAYIDDALEPQQRIAIEELIQQQPAVRNEVQRMVLMRTAIRANASNFAAPAALRARVVAAAAPRRKLWARAIRQLLPDLGNLIPGEVISWRPLGAAFALAALMVWGVSLTMQPSRSNQDFMQAAVTSHLRSMDGEPLVAVASASGRAIAPWVSERLAFAVPIVVPHAENAELVGARMDSLQGRSVAAVVYRVHDHVVNTFVWPATDDSAQIKSASVAGLSISHWSRNGLRYCVVSDLPKAQVVAFAESLAQETGPL